LCGCVDVGNSVTITTVKSTLATSTNHVTLCETGIIGISVVRWNVYRTLRNQLFVLITGIWHWHTWHFIYTCVDANSAYVYFVDFA